MVSKIGKVLLQTNFLREADATKGSGQTLIEPETRINKTAAQVYRENNTGLSIIEVE